MKRIVTWSVLCILYSVLLVCCTPKVQQTKVFGRFVPERKDDFAWENEYAAFRMYGPALKPENPSNGVDLWLKASPELVVDSFYYREHVLGLPYHINYGKGLDCYKVAHTAGCGGLVVLTADDSHLWVGGPYDRWDILMKTPDRLVFRLEYDSLQVANTVLRETITITAEAGQLLNKAEVVLSADNPLPDDISPLCVGGGIYLHDTVDAYRILPETGAVLYAEDALSDKTAARMNYDDNGSTSQGRCYVAVLTPGATVQTVIDGTLVSARPYQLGDTLTYYFGACWSKWQNGDISFPSDMSWWQIFDSGTEIDN